VAAVSAGDTAVNLVVCLVVVHVAETGVSVAVAVTVCHTASRASWCVKCVLSLCGNFCFRTLNPVGLVCRNAKFHGHKILARELASKAAKFC
jgi:hypothetical protein